MDSVRKRLSKRTYAPFEEAGEYDVTVAIFDGNTLSLIDMEGRRVRVRGCFESGDFSKWTENFTTSGETATVVSTMPITACTAVFLLDMEKAVGAIGTR